ncbi:MAG: hypothetical protein NZ518_05010, partial [Dehalococcoidia bacterium]|nr:hypothetical protein [Dehalococcoidia bacterium]
MRKLVMALLALAVFAPLALPGAYPTAEAQVPDFALPGPVRARFYTQASGAPGLGYAVSNADNIPFLDFFERNGGVAVFGFPITHRHLFRGFTIQAFQKLVLQYLPG